MAARVGTGVTGTGDAGATSIASAAKTTTTGNLIVGWAKWESTGVATTVTDTASNSYTVVFQAPHTLGEPSGVMFYAANITGNASNVVTVNFDASVPWRRIVVEEFSGLALSSVLDGSSQTDEGADGTYVTPDIVTTLPGLVFLGISEFGTVTAHDGTPGNPDFSIGATAGDTFVAYLLSGSAQTVTPGATATGAVRHVCAAQAFKDAVAGGAVVPPDKRAKRFFFLGVRH